MTEAGLPIKFQLLWDQNKTSLHSGIKAIIPEVNRKKSIWPAYIYYEFYTVNILWTLNTVTQFCQNDDLLSWPNQHEPTYHTLLPVFTGLHTRLYTKFVGIIFPCCKHTNYEWRLTIEGWRIVNGKKMPIIIYLKINYLIWLFKRLPKGITFHISYLIKHSSE